MINFAFLHNVKIADLCFSFYLIQNNYPVSCLYILLDRSWFIREVSHGDDYQAQGTAVVMTCFGGKYHYCNHKAQP